MRCTQDQRYVTSLLPERVESESILEELMGGVRGERERKLGLVHEMRKDCLNN